MIIQIKWYLFSVKLLKNKQMKRNLQTQKGLKNRFLSGKYFPIFSLCLLLSVFLFLNTSDAIGQTFIEQNPSQEMLMNNRTLDTMEICQGDIFHGLQYNFVDTVYVIEDADTIVYLIVHPAYIIDTFMQMCEGESFEFLGQTITAGGVYPFSFTTQYGCDSIINLNVTEKILPHPHIYGIPNNMEICGGEGSICWTEEEKFDYIWEVGGGEIVFPVDLQGNVMTDSTWIAIVWDTTQNTSNGYVSITYTNTYDCSNTTTYFVNIMQGEHVVLPTITDTICEGDHYVKHGFALYNMEPGIYDTTITIPVYDLCGSDTTKTLRLYVLDNPDVIITPMDTTIYAGQSVTLTVTDISGSTSPTTYQWTWANGGSATGESITVSPNKNTTYYVTATNEIGCWDISLSAIVRILTFFDKPDSLNVTNSDCLPILTWQAPDTTFGFGAHLGYNIYRKRVEDGIFTYLTRVSPATLTYTDIRLGRGEYIYCVKAVYTYPYSLEEVESECDLFTYIPPVPEFFPEPKDVYAYPSNDCHVIVIWETPDPTCWGTVKGYKVYRNKNVGYYEKSWQMLPASQLIFEDKEQHIKGVTYTYCVQAIYEDFEGVSDISAACYSTTVDCGLAINIFPNPANEQVTIVALDMDYIMVYNSIGKYITTISVPRNYCNEITIPTKDWVAGLYLFKIFFLEGTDGKDAVVRRVSIVHQ